MGTIRFTTNDGLRVYRASLSTASGVEIRIGDSLVIACDQPETIQLAMDLLDALDCPVDLFDRVGDVLYHPH